MLSRRLRFYSESPQVLIKLIGFQGKDSFVHNFFILQPVILPNRLQSLSYIRQFLSVFSIFFLPFSQNLYLRFRVIRFQLLIFVFLMPFISSNLSTLKCALRQIEMQPSFFFSLLKSFPPKFHILNQAKQRIWYKLHHLQCIPQIQKNQLSQAFGTVN